MSINTNTFGGKIKAASKVVVAAVGFLAGALVQYGDIVPVGYRGYATAFIALATLVGAYHAPYAPLGRNRGADGVTGGSTDASNAGD